ncbi:cobalt-precorrin-5B (C(1))-methyltransferase [Aureimonas jatrophae]|uniref:Cobalt-precorrin-5B C(1)-methyltransferase n=1 Tax=Aureimonas jatrophae TaxID=1166073 RepID=A0A1H0D8S5_9HYPH|nr:cobalt-precorrin-5B (C(1))-methyltransferase [Aureimonas jatrophae]MBB3951754.1 cobalt-precorrin-5B (C1)-methyltransferase [Aureimonas jatrophae]SDN66371.1 cobalt-precorrin-5B (C1)-methyltransferase [Aureimonas jatrophae]
MGFNLGKRRDGTADPRREGAPLRRGWTTGACATAAAKAAATALLTGRFPDPVEITLPRGETPAFALAREKLNEGEALAAIVKDAGDDPDVTHGAEVWARVRWLSPGCGLVFRAGEGVGTVTKAGLPIPPGEPAINPVPRQMIRAELEALCAAHDRALDAEVTVGVTDGARLAERTWNGRLGILGGLSILGTTGIVHPFSCSAWIHSIHRGIDVARAERVGHVVGATGSTSEAAARRLYPDLPVISYLDMGDFAGGLLKYLRRHPVERLTIAGGFAKLAKLADGALDLHSGRSQVDLGFLAELARKAGADDALDRAIRGANTAKEALDLSAAAGLDIAALVGARALGTVREALRGAPVAPEVVVVDRVGHVIAHAS